MIKIIGIEKHKLFFIYFYNIIIYLLVVINVLMVSILKALSVLEI